MSVGDVRRNLSKGFKSDRERWAPFIAKVYSETKKEWDHARTTAERSRKRVLRMLPAYLEEGKRMMTAPLAQPVLQQDRERQPTMTSPECGLVSPPPPYRGRTGTMINLLNSFSPSQYLCTTPTSGDGGGGCSVGGTSGNSGDGAGGGGSAGGLSGGGADGLSCSGEATTHLEGLLSHVHEIDFSVSNSLVWGKSIT